MYDGYSNLGNGSLLLFFPFDCVTAKGYGSEGVRPEGARGIQEGGDDSETLRGGVQHAEIVVGSVFGRVYGVLPDAEDRLRELVVSFEKRSAKCR